jgi:hypothetical protein
MQVDLANLEVSYAASGAITPAATPTDIATITGSATKTVEIRRIIFTSYATTAGVMTFSLIKRSTADGGGSSTSPTIPPLANGVAATATVLQYTVNPTSLGTSVGAVDTEFAQFPAAGGATSRIIYDAGAATDTQPILLSGTTQQLAVNLNSGTLPTGGQGTYTFMWTER